MNLFYRKYIAKVAVAMLVAGPLLLSCSKDTVEGVVPVDDTKFDGKISVQVLGIEDNEPVPSANLKGKTSSISSVRGNKQLPKVQSFGDFDVVTSVERDVLKQSNVSIGYQSDASTNGNVQMAALMKPDVQYRLLLYKSDGTFVSSTLLTSGTAGAVDAEKGVAYDWYAISYNSTEAVPDVADHANPVITPTGNKDVLYAKGSITVPTGSPDGNTALGITFKHSMARVGIELNTMGMFANMNSATVTVSGLSVKRGTMDLKTGTFSALTTSTEVVDYSTFTNVDPLYGDAKVAYVYTADNTPISGLSVEIAGLSIQLDNNTARTFTTASTFTFNITPVLGGSHTAKINLIESPLTLGGVKWGRANVYYNGGHNPYRFHHTYAPTQNLNSYFSFNSKIPGQYGFNTVPGDPCADVYPAGIWRQATPADYSVLTNGIGGLGGPPITYGTEAGSGYFEYTTATGTAAPYPSNRLRFNFNGEGVNISIIEGLIEVEIGNNGTEAHVWTSEPLLAIPPLLSVGAMYYTATHTTFPVTVNNASIATGLLDIDLLGLQVIESNFKNVRCVRAN